MMLRSLHHSLVYLIASMLLMTIALDGLAESTLPKLVYLIEEDGELIASNIKFNRFDELKLQAKESVVQYAVANAVIVLVTNKRIVAYSVYAASWKILDREADEQVKTISAEDYAALVVTSKRYLSFNGKTGVWAETQRSKIFH